MNSKLELEIREGIRCLVGQAAIEPADEAVALLSEALDELRAVAARRIRDKQPGLLDQLVRAADRYRTVPTLGRLFWAVRGEILASRRITSPRMGSFVGTRRELELASDRELALAEELGQLRHAIDEGLCKGYWLCPACGRAHSADEGIELPDPPANALPGRVEVIGSSQELTEILPRHPQQTEAPARSDQPAPRARKEKVHTRSRGGTGDDSTPSAEEGQCPTEGERDVSESDR